MHRVTFGAPRCVCVSRTALRPNPAHRIASALVIGAPKFVRAPRDLRRNALRPSPALRPRALRRTVLCPRPALRLHTA